MDVKPTIRIFISSPSDVRPERLKAEQIVARLRSEFAYHFDVEAVLWERQPLVATHHFQDEENLIPPRQTDIVVVILWKRLGLWLPEEKYFGAVSGRRPVTGTEWEFEDALAGARTNDGVPDLLFYRKIAKKTADDIDDDHALEEIRTQRNLADEFVRRWFHSADEKSLTAARHSFATTTDFEELLYQHLRMLLERRAGKGEQGVAIRWHREPFRGLLSFEFEHAPIFFGRDRARNELRELVGRQDARHQGFILVLGASGSGKSSLVKAGLLPDLMLPGMIGRVALVRWGLMRPSDIPGDPVGALSAAMLSPTALPALLELRYTPDRISALLKNAPNEAAVAIEQGLTQYGKGIGLTGLGEARLVIVVDQLEEIFSGAGVDQTAREAFVAALIALASCGLVWIVATMRSDFYDRLETIPALAHLATENACYHLLPPDEADLGQIIRRPVREAGLHFEYDKHEGKSLDEVIHQAAIKGRDVLPLLSFLLDQLWKQHTDRGELTFASYRNLGGLEGAIAKQAEACLAALPETTRTALPRVLRALVIAGQNAEAIVTARTASLDRFIKGGPERDLIDSFLLARLLVSDQGEGGVRIRVAHEALLNRWDRAHAWINERRGDLQLEARLEAGAARWAAAGSADKDSLLLASGLPLSEAQDLLARCRDDLPGGTVAFVDASAAAEADRQKTEQEYYLKLLRPTAFGLIFNVVPIGAALLIFLLLSGVLVGGTSEIYLSYFEREGIEGFVKAGFAAAALMLLSAALYESHLVLSALCINLIYGHGSTPDAHSKMSGVQRGTGLVVALLPGLGVAVGLYTARNFIENRYCQLLDLAYVPRDQLASMLHISQPSGGAIAAAFIALGVSLAIFAAFARPDRIWRFAVVIPSFMLVVLLFMPDMRDTISLVFVCSIAALFTLAYFVIDLRVHPEPGTSLSSRGGIQSSKYRKVLPHWMSQLSWLGISSGPDAGFHHLRRGILVAWAFVPCICFGIVSFFATPQFFFSIRCGTGANFSISPRLSIFPIAVALVLSGSLLIVTLLDKFRKSFAFRCLTSGVIVALALGVWITAQIDANFFVLLFRSIGPLGTITLDLVFLISLLTLLTVVCQRSEFPARLLILFSIMMPVIFYKFIAVPIVVAVFVGLLANKVFGLRMRYSIGLAVFVFVLRGMSLNQLIERGVPQNLEQPLVTQSPISVRTAYLCWLDQKGLPATRTAEQESSCGRRPEALPPVRRPYPVFIVVAGDEGIYAASAASLFLATLQDSSPYFVEHIFAITGASGGAIGSTIFQALTKAATTPDVSTRRPAQQELRNTKGSLTEQIESIVGGDYLSPIIGAVFPEFLGAATGRAEALAKGFEVSVAESHPAAGRILANRFLDHWSLGSTGPALILNTTWLETGMRVAFAPFRLHDLNPSLYSFRDPGMPDLNCSSASSEPDSCTSLISAAVSSARYLPTLPPLSVRLTTDRHWNFADGGYSDGSGVRSALDIFRALNRLYPDEIDLRMILITSSNVEPNLADGSIDGTVGVFGGNIGTVEGSANAAVAEACGEMYGYHPEQGTVMCIEHAGVRDYSRPSISDRR